MATLELEMTQHNLYNVADDILNTLDPGYVSQLIEMLYRTGVGIFRPRG